MIQDFISNKITEQLPFEPNKSQHQLIGEISSFLMSKERNEIFLLRGFAGTGKTSVVSALVKAMSELQQKFILLAPTGRAAKVFSAYSGHAAYTIHKKIYLQKTDGSFELGYNKYPHTLFIVDEASMISNTAQSGQNPFGSGRLLDDLIEFVYSNDGCRLMLVGDTAQLPPVISEYSPALDPQELKSAGFDVRDFLLTDVVRQSSESGILYNATKVRKQIEDEAFLVKPDLKLNGYGDIENLSGEYLEEKLQDSYRTVGIDESIIITRSNKRANIYSNGIRNKILYKEDELTNGDLLIISKNNYFWAKEHKEIDFIANGDIAEIVRMRKHYDMYDLRFADVTLKLTDYDAEIDTRILLDTLHADTPAEIADINAKLFEKVQEDYMHIPSRRNRMQEMRKDPYLNALQVKFAYAVTCHKAQGGQWKHVYIDHGNIREEMMDIQYYRWLYTAITRATEKVFLINFNKNDEF